MTTIVEYPRALGENDRQNVREMHRWCCELADKLSLALAQQDTKDLAEETQRLARQVETLKGEVQRMTRKVEALERSMNGGDGE